jgi:hypothetical protein
MSERGSEAPLAIKENQEEAESPRIVSTELARVEGKSGELPLPEVRIVSSTTARLRALKTQQPAVFWPWLGGLLLVGLVIVAIVTFSAWNWLNGVQSNITVKQPASQAVTTMNVQRSGIYLGVTFTLVNIQSATTFSDDPIHTGPATLRLTVQVHNTAKNVIDLEYYDIVRLLIPKQTPVVPTNLTLLPTPAAGAAQTGWIDFPVARNIVLSTLQLQLGNSAIGETLVTIPASGSYDASHFADHLYHPSISPIYYYYGPYGDKHELVYHLNSVNVSYSYNGTEATAGQQFYSLNFTVDNPNGIQVSPGYGYDYIRLVLGSNHPPVYNTLPNGFKAGAQGVSGSVIYEAGAGMHNLTIEFLTQYYQGGDDYSFSL